MIREYLNGMSIRSQVKEGLFARNTDGMRALRGRIDKDTELIYKSMEPSRPD